MCKVVARSSVTPLTDLARKDPLVMADVLTFDNSIKSKIGTDRTDLEIKDDLGILFPVDPVRGK